MNIFEVIHQSLSGFRKIHSTETALLLMTETWLKALNEDKIVGTVLVDFRKAFIRFTTSAFRKLLSIDVFSYFPFGFEGRIWDLIVSVPDHFLSSYFDLVRHNLLLQNLSYYKCSDHFPKLMKSYLSNREQVVGLNNNLWHPFKAPSKVHYSF